MHCCLSCWPLASVCTSLYSYRSTCSGLVGRKGAGLQDGCTVQAMAFSACCRFVYIRWVEPLERELSRKLVALSLFLVKGSCRPVLCGGCVALCCAAAKMLPIYPTPGKQTF